jgi:hypothetical protein
LQAKRPYPKAHAQESRHAPRRRIAHFHVHTARRSHDADAGPPFHALDHAARTGEQQTQSPAIEA